MGAHCWHGCMLCVVVFHIASHEHLRYGVLGYERTGARKVSHSGSRAWIAYIACGRRASEPKNAALGDVGLLHSPLGDHGRFPACPKLALRCCGRGRNCTPWRCERFWAYRLGLLAACVRSGLLRSVFCEVVCDYRLPHRLVRFYTWWVENRPHRFPACRGLMFRLRLRGEQFR